MNFKNSSVTMSDVAKLAGVSMMTVSRVIGNETKVRESTRNKVRAAITQLGYKPNISARNLASSKSHLIAFLYNNPSEGYIGQLLIGAMHKSQPQGYNLVLNFVQSEEDGVEENIREFIESSRVDGIILSPPFSDSEALVKLVQDIELPTIRISPQSKNFSIPYVCMDEVRAAFDMTEHLINKGHKKIAFIKGHPDHSGSHMRFSGYEKALKKHNIEIPDTYIEQGMFNYKSGHIAANTLLTLPDRPTAIFASNDDMAAAVLSAAQKHNITVPKELSVVGFDDSPIATSIWPCLTTIRQPTLEIAEMATQMLIDRLNGVSPASNTMKQTMDYQLIVRETVSTATC